MKAVDWGSVPDWLQGFGAMFALLFAAWAVYTGRETNAQQTRQIAALERAEELRVQEQREQHAVRLACWISATRLDDEVSGKLAVAVKLVNSSELPIRRLTIYVGCMQGVVFAKYNHVGPLSSRRTMDRPTHGIRKLLEGTDGRQALDSGELWIAVTFRDPADRWWYRGPSGSLCEVDDEQTASRMCRNAIAIYYLAVLCDGD